jgi:hypothetical protein
MGTSLTDQFLLCQVIHTYQAQREDELDLNQGDILRILTPKTSVDAADEDSLEINSFMDENGWCRGVSPNLSVGHFPFKSHTRLIPLSAVPNEKHWNWVRVLFFL